MMFAVSEPFDTAGHVHVCLGMSICLYHGEKSIGDVVVIVEIPASIGQKYTALTREDLSRNVEELQEHCPLVQLV